MRTLIYGMQNSGASTYTLYLSQKKDCLGIIDLNNHRLAPFIDTPHDIHLKCVITTRYSLEQHVSAFRPDKIVLFVRNPYENHLSLKNKAYANKSGQMEEKFKILDKVFKSKSRFDEVIYFEQFIKDHAGYRFERSREQIRNFNDKHSIWCKNNPTASGEEGGWGFGQSSGIEIVRAKRRFIDEETKLTVRNSCPNACQYYDEVFSGL